ncbi:hypothetical protein D9M68_606000 [compost metagenome]
MKSAKRFTNFLAASVGSVSMKDAAMMVPSFSCALSMEFSLAAPYTVPTSVMFFLPMVDSNWR